jgi:hypothetical protein
MLLESNSMFVFSHYPSNGLLMTLSGLACSIHVFLWLSVQGHWQVLLSFYHDFSLFYFDRCLLTE